jgi:hypothetical protein
MLQKIISGGQTGADQAAWRAAEAFGVQTGGWMPQAFVTEDGPRPELAQRYGAAELPAFSGPFWVEQNVRDADATLWFGATTTDDARTTVAACLRFGKPCLPVAPGVSFEPSHVAAWIRENAVGVLNVAGNREAVDPGIGATVEQFLRAVLAQLGLAATP